MSTQKSIKLSDYVEYPFLIPSIYLDFDIGTDYVVVQSSMIIKPKKKESSKLVLKGNQIKLLSISINGKELKLPEYSISDKGLIIHSPPGSEFELKIRSLIDPFRNTSLEGLYLSSGMLTTQCEAEGFRRICFHPDRPDVLSRYTVRIEADRTLYPILLSNGNEKYSGNLNSNNLRHEFIWEDPFPKPCYLFALVAGKLNSVSDTYITNTGRLIDIRIYVEKGDEKYTKHAVNSLIKAMKWDEENYGLEYDLDEYKIVAVRHFNMGAMENKGLNIFNSKLVLADSKTATDDELERIESVIAHEYFHNWTGNRITCRDWFQLSLKEGLTVFRDQSFTSDLHSKGLKRIEDVSFLRNFQFAEDKGPTSHAVKPKEYVAIDNFYTTTIYEKGAELIRMLELLLGKEKFFRGINLYIRTFDGSAATTEDFINSLIKGAYLEEKNCPFDLDKFLNWYYKSGTPKVYINQSWDSKNSILNVSFEQKIDSEKTSENTEMVIPILYSCYSREKGASPIAEDNLFILDKNKKNLKIHTLPGEKEAPVLSLFRRFSSPVVWESDLLIDDYLFLFLNDNDYFSRWDSGQYLMREILKTRLCNKANYSLEDRFINAIKQTIKSLEINDPFFLATLIAIPGFAELESLFTKVDPIRIYRESIDFQVLIGNEILQELRIISKNLLVNIDHQWPMGRGERKLLGTIWFYLSLAGDIDVQKNCVESISHSSMTISRAALGALKPLDNTLTEEASNLFYNLWKENPVVLDSWFAYEASRPHKRGINVIEKLLSHPKFDWKAPNAIRAVLGGFSKNIDLFHSLDGQGYLFMADKLIEVDKINPITASRMVKVFSKWKTYINKNKEGMYESLLKLNKANISSNTREVVELILN
ncbi:alanyl aminopeptidase, Metallo peptidase, MEROPS family M01 [Prochlorococcus marinus str. NATL2A]|uniref:Aminopeptidase N n=1 Tax=Prochlorococcus marinus (strain NATL2A) TaxID=59920 RepID=Q46K16_PROMT|nr:aminopeptidase N [Prochlorococcus marinus]AAZ58162.1 alanyl aminopeptidase, Metallo peptidase, MEROPS family M01 [Prochlorococcus marinus str. NATL2A]